MRFLITYEDRATGMCGYVIVEGFTAGARTRSLRKLFPHAITTGFIGAVDNDGNLM